MPNQMIISLIFSLFIKFILGSEVSTLPTTPSDTPVDYESIKQYKLDSSEVEKALLLLKNKEKDVSYEKESINPESVKEVFNDETDSKFSGKTMQ